VAAFLAGQIPFLAIPQIVGNALGRHVNFEPTDLAAVLGADSKARHDATLDLKNFK
jgi:1-deoxy-D-xylulose 5-phosphate reductoisomerase